LHSTWRTSCLATTELRFPVITVRSSLAAGPISAGREQKKETPGTLDERGCRELQRTVPAQGMHRQPEPGAPITEGTFEP
jgi:hypothetical protein